jgi:hypothetical protein
MHSWSDSPYRIYRAAAEWPERPRPGTFLFVATVEVIPAEFSHDRCVADIVARTSHYESLGIVRKRPSWP